MKTVLDRSVKNLQQEINDCKYELDLIHHGLRKKGGRKALEERIKTLRGKIREIKLSKKLQKH